MKHDLGTWVEELRHIRVPVLEHSVHNFRRLLLQDGTTVAHFTKVMDSDPALTFALLRHVHTVMGDRLQEDHVLPETAITLLGFEPIENLLSKLPVVRARDRDSKSRAMRRLARQSSFLRYLTQAWCEQRHDVCPPETILAARLSVIMEMALWEAGAKDSLLAIDKGLLVADANYGELQQQHLGVRINELNHRLGKSWGLPDILSREAGGSPVDTMHKLAIGQASLLGRLISVDWQHPGLPSLYEWVAFYLHVDPDEARKHLVQVALYAARRDSDIGLPALAAGLMRLTYAAPRRDQAVSSKSSQASTPETKADSPLLMTQERNVSEGLGLGIEINPDSGSKPVKEAVVSITQARETVAKEVQIELSESDDIAGGAEQAAAEVSESNAESLKMPTIEVEQATPKPDKVVDIASRRKSEPEVVEANDLLEQLPQTLEPDPGFLKSAYKQIDHLDAHGLLLEHMLQALHKGLGLQRAMVLMGVRGEKALEVRYHRFWENDPALRNMKISLAKPSLFSKLMKDERALWLSSKNRMQLWPYLPTNFRDLIRVREFFLMTIMLKGRPIGFVYADRFRGAQPLDDHSYQQFKAVVHHSIERMNAI